MYKKKYKKPDGTYYNYDYGGYIDLTYKKYGETENIPKYDLLQYFDDDDVEKTIRPHDSGVDSDFHGFFTPGTVDGVANIEINAHKNNPIQVTISTNGKVMVRNLSEYNEEYNPNDFERVKSIGELLIMIPNTYATTNTPVYDPGKLTLAILPKKKDGDYDKYEVVLIVNGESKKPKRITFEKDGYVLDINSLNDDEPFDPTKWYKIDFKALHKYIPKTITLKEYNQTEDGAQKYAADRVDLNFADYSSVDFPPRYPDDEGHYKETTLYTGNMYFSHQYKTEETDFSDDNQSTFWVYFQLNKDEEYLDYWNKFFEINNEER